MILQELKNHVREHGGIDGADTGPWARRIGTLADEVEYLALLNAGTEIPLDGRIRPGMPGDNGIEPVEETGLRHHGFARAEFFGGGAERDDRSGDAVGPHGFGDSNRRCRAGDRLPHGDRKPAPVFLPALHRTRT